MNEFRRCRNTWMYCDGHCGRCATVITTDVADVGKIVDELSKVPWYNREDEKQAVRIVKRFSATDSQLLVNENRASCKLRHENGNCLCVGGFCTAINDEICKAIRMSYEKGYIDGKIDKAEE